MARSDQILALLSSDPDDIDLHYMLAMSYRSEGDHARAIAKFDDCIGMNAAYHPAYFQKATTLVQTGESEPARAVLDEGIAQATSAGDVHAAEEMHAMRDSLG
jgi:predicted Zn-dependent protease